MIWSFFYLRNKKSITHHVLNPLIINKYGAYGIKDPSKINGWSAVSASEGMIP